jgi:hypothetical protein
MNKMLAAALCLALFVAFPVLGDQWNKKTVMTFNQAVELPGIVLPPGTYVFKLLDSLSNRNIVQVFNEEENHIYATILAISNYRITTPEETIVQFAERPPRTPQAVKAWFYPGDNFGQEFVYPKARATELAQVAQAPVPAAEVTPTETPEELLKAPVVAITPEKKEVEIAEVIEPKPVEEQPAPAVVAPPPVPTPVPAPVELPKTASPVPLIAVGGFLSLGLAAATKLISKLIS